MGQVYRARDTKLDWDVAQPCTRSAFSARATATDFGGDAMRRVVLSLGFTVGIGMIAACERENLPPGSSSTSSPSTTAATVEETAIQYTVVDDSVDESPGKTQVTLNVLVPESASEADLRNLLDGLYREASGRTGFRHHRNPTVIGIYAYPSREHAGSGMGQWSLPPRCTSRIRIPRAARGKAQPTVSLMPISTSSTASSRFKCGAALTACGGGETACASTRRVDGF